MPVRVLGAGQAHRSLDISLEAAADWFVVAVEFVDDDEVGDLHDPFFRALEAVTATGRHHIDHKVDYVVYLDLTLTHSHRFHQNSVKPCMLTQKLHFSRAQRHAP